MKIGEIIREKRRELSLTQEQQALIRAWKEAAHG